MEGKTNKGGKRVGAGRKPIGTSKKIPVTLYVEQRSTYSFGNVEKMKEVLYDVIAKGGILPTTCEVKDLNRLTNEVKPIEPQGTTKSNYSIDTTPKVVQPLMSRFEHHKAIILKTETIPQVEAALKAAKADLLNGRERAQLEQIAKQHSTTMYND